MGSWGFGVMHDDDASDAFDSVKKLYNRSIPKDQALAQIMEEYRQQLQDADTGLPTLLGIAKACWTYGWLDQSMIKQVEAGIRKSSGLARWTAGGAKVAAQRQAALQIFLTQLNTTPTKIPKPKKPIQRKPPYRTGACLSYRMKDGRYAALLVVRHEEIDPLGLEETFGTILVAGLEYASHTQPTFEHFRNLKALEYQYPPPSDLGAHILCLWVYPWSIKEHRERISYVGDVEIPDWHLREGATTTLGYFDKQITRTIPQKQ